MKSYPRSDRVGELIHRVVSELLRKKIKDPRLQMTTVTGVRMSDDLRHARVYFMAQGGASGRKDATDGFESARGYLKRVLAEQLGLRYMPEITFLYDESFEHGWRIDTLLRSIQENHGSD